ncbi:DUF4399 domain-containing protein [Roseicella frigidaeris]|uniref:ATPase n=1 Tax=Roseicella frigidaeris TaxID=2230885 RepID=A0A327M946_9PROT|nr:DUF4399 domain-containing protein [Roseicella frigidaeris]RAI58814.1 ATPase [Roseicella frigidaeris]
MAFTRRLLLLGAAALPATARSQGQPADHAHDAAAPAPAPAAPPAEAPRQRGSAPPDAYVYIGWPQDRQVIYGTRFKVWFGTRNFGVAPAGVTKANTGHHHLLVDVDLPDLNKPIPNDRNHLHFGLGQTETMLELPPGTHTLQLLMGDADHVPQDPPVMSKRITITVRPGRPQAAARETQ